MFYDVVRISIQRIRFRPAPIITSNPRHSSKAPNIGDFKDVEVIEVLVSEGQTLKKNDPLITIESDKSSVEIPSNFDGKIKTLKTKVGDKVSEGDLILILENINEVQEKVEKKPAIKKENGSRAQVVNAKKKDEERGEMASS